MAHFFNRSQYYDFRQKIYTSIKKTLESKIEQAAEGQIGDLHHCDGTDQILIDGAYVNFVYQNQTLQLPVKLLEVKNLKSLLNMETIKQNFREQEINELYEYLPCNQKNQEGLRYALQGSKQKQKNGFQGTPLQNFQRKLKKGYFSALREKQDQINQKLNEDWMYRYYVNLMEELKNQKQKKKAQKIIIRQQQSSIESFQDLNIVEQISQNNQTTQSQEEINNQFDQEISNRVFFRYDYTKLKTQEELLAMGEEKAEKKIGIIKTTVTVRPRNQEWVDNYRKQELQRYSNPTKPWIYQCQDGRKVTVAPVAKKMSVLTGKPRDHHMLKIERPACVTILSLVRDAAARLVNGVGTRADICELLKESQYINDDLPDDKLSGIVSGALDRLHYLSDACVKYDSQKKLWIYLHTDRNNEHPGWGEDGEEYIEKKNYKKRKNDFQ